MELRLNSDKSELLIVTVVPNSGGVSLRLKLSKETVS